MTRLAALIAAATVLVGCSVVAQVSQPAQVEWDNANDVGPADRAAILRLAHRLGIEQPRRVSFTAYVPSFCEFVRVESVVTVEGNRRSWLELALRRRDWPACWRVRRFSRRSDGQWRGSRAELSTEEEWRIADGDWFIDTRLGDRVAYDVAKRIVLAIRDNSLVNRLPSSVGLLKLDTTMPQIDASEIRSITVDKSNADMYEVRTGQRAGLVYSIRIRDETIELHGIGSWMVHLEKPPEEIASDRLAGGRDLCTA